MDNASVNRPAFVAVSADKDRFDEQRGLGVSIIDFKISAQDSLDMFIVENKFQEKGGPARHIHPHQDEWFYVVDGEFVFEIDKERFNLRTGDSLFAPRGIPHVWAHIGEGQGRLLIVFTPAGDMEAFFREVTQANVMPPQNPALWEAHGMQLVGPPLAID